MAKRFNMFVSVAMMLVGALFQGSVALTTHVVGGTTGWTIPSGGASTYATWASQQTFSVGDVLVFNFASGTHDVAEVTKAAFDTCGTTNPISSNTTTPTRVTLTSPGEHHYICTFSGHCNGGQKLSIAVSGASTAATPPSSIATPPSSSSVPPSTFPSSESPSGSFVPPPSNVASSLAAAGLPVVALLSLALAFLH